MSKEVFAIKQELRINEEITAKIVKLIDDNGAQLGEMPIAEALKIADKKIRDKLKDGEEILTKKVLKKEVNNSKIRVEVFLKVKEDITSYQEINNINSQDGG